MKLKSFLKIAIIGLLVSCSDENIIFNDYVDIENTQLSFKDTIVFQTKITDTINPHNIFLQLRTSTDYKWSNMFVFSEIYFPNNKTRTDTFEVFLMDKKGNWNGDKSGIVVNFNHSLYKNIKFPINGDYKFRLIQAMRDTILKDVMSVGIKITKPIKKL
jgi:gliding motility-associated lipoprotein GldH